jgi:hypothetical protein
MCEDCPDLNAMVERALAALREAAGGDAAMRYRRSPVLDGLATDPKHWTYEVSDDSHPTIVRVPQVRHISVDGTGPVCMTPVTTVEVTFDRYKHLPECRRCLDAIGLLNFLSAGAEGAA